MGAATDRGQVLDVGGVGGGVGVHVLEVSDEHPELRAPVADVVDALHGVAWVVGA